jgi:hypothetical protein
MNRRKKEGKIFVRRGRRGMSSCILKAVGLGYMVYFQI